MGVHFGRPVIIRAREWYVSPICYVMWVAPVHHISYPHIMAGIAVVTARWWSALEEPSFRLVVLERWLAARRVAA